MSDYINSTCPVCNEKFKEGDDIVVCPECGTPHHRACYKELGKCANTPKHGEFVWENSNTEKQVQTSNEQNFFPNIFSDSKDESSKKCPVCGAENPHNNKYCSSCGSPLSAESKNTQYSYTPYNIFSGVNFNGASAEEVTEAVGRGSAFYFLTRFRYFTEGHKISPNLSALLFSYFYLFYRKMYNVGISVFITVTLLSIPGMLVEFQALQELYVEQGYLSQVIYNVPNLETLEIYATVGNLLVWAIRIALFLFFNYLYYFKITATIKGVKDGLKQANMYTPENFVKFIRKRCQTSMSIPVVILVLTLMFSIAVAAYLVTSPYFIFK